MGSVGVFMVFAGVFVVAYLTNWWLVRSWEHVTPPADPWDKATGDALEKPDAQPVCLALFLYRRATLPAANARPAPRETPPGRQPRHE